MLFMGKFTINGESLCYSWVNSLDMCHFPFFMGKFTINVPFSIANCWFTRLGKPKKISQGQWLSRSDPEGLGRDRWLLHLGEIFCLGFP